MMGMLSRALIFDCVYDQFKWVVAYVKICNGTFQAGQIVDLIYSEKSLTITEVGFFNPNYVVDKVLSVGQIGYIVTWQKSVRDVKIGDTIIRWHTVPKIVSDSPHLAHPLLTYAIPGFQKIKPYVYAGVYPIGSHDFDKLRDSFEKLSLNDSAVEYEYENNKAMGFGFRCGFLGMLHMDIIKERLSREHGMETIFTIPNVVYLVKCKNLTHEKIKSGTNILELIQTGLYRYVFQYLGIKNYESQAALRLSRQESSSDTQLLENTLHAWIVVRSGADMVADGMIDEILEPMADVEVVGPSEYYGNISALCQDYRGVLKGTEYIDDTRVIWKYTMPLGEIIIDFYDKLKGLTKWYATMNYEFHGYQSSNLSKLDIMINSELVEAFTMIVYTANAHRVGNEMTTKLKELIPKHLFSIPIQAAIGSKIVARETISAVKKDVLAKCYGGDVSRKRKLLEKQKEGKKKMKEIGKVSIPSDIFIKMVVR